MRYLPILEELFESDSILFFVIGLIIMMNIALRTKKEKRTKVFLSVFLVTIVLYFICEVLVGLASSYLLELVTLIIGTMCLGAAFGILLGIILTKVFRIIRNEEEIE